MGASGFGLILNALLGEQSLQDLSAQSALLSHAATEGSAPGFEAAADWGFWAIVLVSLVNLVVCLLAPRAKREPGGLE
jgi:hypothetical protein